MKYLSRRQAVPAALIALPWLNPFTAGPSAAVVPWLVSAACGLGLLLLAIASGGARANRPLLVLSVLVVAWTTLSQGTLGQDGLALAGGLALICATACVAADSSTAGALRTGLLLAAVLNALAGMVQYAGVAHAWAPWINYAFAGEAYGNLRQPNQFASLCWLGMAVLLWGAPRIPLGSAMCLAVLLGVAAASSVSRTGTLQGLLLIGLCLCWRATDRRRLLVLCAIAVAAYVAATVLLPFLLQWSGVQPSRTLWGRISGGENCSSRSVLWSNVLRLIGHRPILGWGWGELDYAHFMTLYPGPRFCDILDNAHNLPLHLAVELGVPVALILCVVAVAWVWRQRPWAEHDPARQLAWALLAVILLHSLVEYPLWYGPFQMAFGTSIGWLSNGRLQRHPATVWGRTIGVAVAGVLLAATAFAGWDYWRVTQVYLPPEHRRPVWREYPLEEARHSWLFATQVRFAELTLTSVDRTNASPTLALAQEMLHYSPEPRVIERLIEAETLLGKQEEAVQILARYRAAFPADYARWREHSTGIGGARSFQD